MTISLKIRGKNLSEHLHTSLNAISDSMTTIEIADLLFPNSDQVKHHLLDCWFSEDLFPCEALGIIGEGYQIERMGSIYFHTIGFETDGNLSYIEGLEQWLGILVGILEREERFAIGGTQFESRSQQSIRYEIPLYEVGSEASLDPFVKQDTQASTYSFYVSPRGTKLSQGSLLSAKKTMQWIDCFVNYFELGDRLISYAAVGDHEPDKIQISTKDENSVYKFINAKAFFFSPSEFELELDSDCWLYLSVRDALGSALRNIPGSSLSTSIFSVGIYTYGFRIVFSGDFGGKNVELETEISSGPLAKLIGDMFLHVTQKVAEFYLISGEYHPHNHWRMITQSESVQLDEFGENDSITNLLRANGSKMSAVKVNKILLRLGILEELHRESKSQKGKLKKFKSLTSEGLKYGINKENYNNPEETAPYYFVNIFRELFTLIEENS